MRYQIVTFTWAGYKPVSRVYKNRDAAYKRAKKMNAGSTYNPYAVACFWGAK